MICMDSTNSIHQKQSNTPKAMRNALQFGGGIQNAISTPNLHIL